MNKREFTPEQITQIEAAFAKSGIQGPEGVPANLTPFEKYHIMVHLGISIVLLTVNDGLPTSGVGTTELTSDGLQITPKKLFHR